MMSLKVFFSAIKKSSVVKMVATLVGFGWLLDIIWMYYYSADENIFICPKTRCHIVWIEFLEWLLFLRQFVTSGSSSHPQGLIMGSGWWSRPGTRSTSKKQAAHVNAWTFTCTWYYFAWTSPYTNGLVFRFFLVLAQRQFAEMMAYHVDEPAPYPRWHSKLN